MTPIFITGIGTGIGKTLIAAIITEALEANYWKPVQAGIDGGTDSLAVKNLITNNKSIIHPEAYILRMAASPHLAAKAENIKISIDKIVENFPVTTNQLIIESAGGLMVPLNDEEFVIDLIRQLKAKVIIVSKNYLGSINHSLLTASVLKQNNIPVLGWIFNDEYMNYESEIADWSGFPVIASIKQLIKIDKISVFEQAEKIKQRLNYFIKK